MPSVSVEDHVTGRSAVPCDNEQMPVPSKDAMAAATSRQLKEAKDEDGSCTVADDVAVQDGKCRLVDDVAPDGGWGWMIVFVSFLCAAVVDGLCSAFGVMLPELVTYFDQSSSTVAVAGSLLAGGFLLYGR